jgi:hypothetical protein
MKKFTAVFLACLLLISTLSVVCYAVSESDFYGADDKPFFSEKYLGTVESGYPLYYYEVPSPPWMCEFSHQYGGYIITNYNGNAEKDNGFYLKNEGERIYLSEAFEKGWTDIEEVVSLTKENAPELYNYRIFSVKDAEKLVKERYNDNIKLEYVGIIYAGYYLFYENDLEKALVEWVLDFQFGDYAFRAFGGHTGNVEPEALGLYVMNDGKILNIKEAYEQIPKSAFGDNYDLVNIIKSKKLNYSFTVSRKSDIKETTEPIETTVSTAPAEIPTTEPGEQCTAMIPWIEHETYTIPPTTATVAEPGVTEPEESVPKASPETPKSVYLKLKQKKNKYYELDIFKKLKDGIYLTHQYAGMPSGCYRGYCVDKYIYYICDDEFAAHIYDYKHNKEYKLINAYNKGVISKKNLAKISAILTKADVNGASLNKNEEEIKAGETTPLYQFFAEYGKKKVKISNRKVVKFVTDEKGFVFAGLKKGKATVTIIQKRGKPVSQKIIVKSNPKLRNKKGKKIKVLSVKYGSIAKVYIKGKVKGVNNKYKNTSYAAFVSGKSAKVLKIRGLKRGKTTLKIFVNGYKLKLKVKVK